MRQLPLLLCLLLGGADCAAADAAELYRDHCGGCHGEQRLGGMGPALLPENLGRLAREAAIDVVLHGRAATQMPGFSGVLGRADAQALVDFVYTPLPQTPRWALAEISASHRVLKNVHELAERPRHDADPLNLFVVVELGDHHASILDGDRFERIHRFRTHFALHGGPKFSADGRFVFFASRDGWISKFDLWGLESTAEIRAGINTRNLAVSSDDRYVLVANYLPHTLVLLDADDLSPVRVIAIADDEGRTSRASAAYTAAPRGSFVVALKDLPEIWEIPYRDAGALPERSPDPGTAPRVPAAAPATSFAPRRILLDDYLDDFFFTPDYRQVIGAARNGRNGQVVDLDLGRRIAHLPLDGLPHLGSGISWLRAGRPVLATPNLSAAEVTVIDMRSWEVVRRIPTLGPGFFMRSHENSRHAWVDVFSGEHRDAVHIIDKETLEIAATVRPAPGRTAAHVEFDRMGKHALVSIWEEDGAIVVYDTHTLEETKRIPMNKPSGKYNVYNKITRSTGTSH